MFQSCEGTQRPREPAVPARACFPLSYLVAHLRNHRGFKTHLLSLLCRSLSLPCCPEPSSAQQTCYWLCVRAPSQKPSLVPRQEQIPPLALLCRTALPILASSCCAGHWKDSSVLPGCKYRAGRDAGDKQSLADVFSASEPLHLAVACTQMIYGVAGLQ